MKELLPLLPRPSRYIGSEWGTVHKDPATVSVHIALAFPDLYEVGMSYMGQKILLESVNRIDDFWAERVYAPCQETTEILRSRATPLATLESDTPLADLDALAFSLTHEMCYTNVLYMLDLAGLPLRSADRDGSHPLVMAGGGACFNAEPLAPFVDLMLVGDGEEALPAVLERIKAAKAAGLDRRAVLLDLTRVPGVYVPSFFEDQGPDLPLKPLVPGYETVEKAMVDDLSAAPFPVNQPVSFGQAVHDRLTMEIARGCTRGCRFCQAGMIYRPVRERSLEELERILIDGLASTGFEETSFLSLSTGDFSALDTLFSQSFDRCAAEQIAISLPSLRVGSLSAPIMERISSIRRTGATLAPEAGSQRLRDVINKGVDEEGLLSHVRMLFENGWQSVKLYFMIGLPTETDEDLDAILDLCLKVRDVAGPHVKRLQVTAAVSPFVPKPHTPFQWEPQIGLAEINRRLDRLFDAFRRHKRIKLKTHNPKMSYLEGVFARGDRRLAPVVENAYRRGAIFSSWTDHLNLSVYLDALAEQGLNPEMYLAARSTDAPLPWDHLSCGLTRRFLLTERERALTGKITEDCRYHPCRNCGVCDHDGRVSELTAQSLSKDIRPRIIFTERDQAGEQPPYSAETPDLTIKEGHYRIWYEKTGMAAYLSQLELQSVFERSFRRAKFPVSFSAGFHPMPRLSFGKALPVGVESDQEWINLFLRQDLEPTEVAERLNAAMPLGLSILSVDRLSMGKKQLQSVEEDFSLDLCGSDDKISTYRRRWDAFMATDTHLTERKTKKGTMKQVNIRPMVKGLRHTDAGLELTLDWREQYMSPLTLARTVMDAPLTDFSMRKLRQRFPEE